MLRFFVYLTLFVLPTSLFGQTLVADINTKLKSSNPIFLRAGEDNIFFIANIEGEVEEICATDGEQVTLIDLLPDLAYSDKTKVKFAKVFDNVAYYGVYSSSDTLVDIYSLNLGNHTRQLLGQYAIHEFSDLLSPFLTALNGEVYFVLRTGGRAFSFYKTNGTPEGTQFISFLPQLPDDIIELNGQLLIQFRFSDQHTELWTSDGTAIGTQLLKSFDPLDIYLDDYNFFKHQNQAYFTARTDAWGQELWQTDGTTTGTKMTADVLTGSGSSAPANFGVLNDQIFFSAETPSTGRELFSVKDSTAYLLKDIKVGEADNKIRILGTINDFLLFTAIDDTHGREVWRTDGTSIGTELVEDINQGKDDGIRFSTPSEVYNEQLYFVAFDSLNGSTIRTTDGLVTKTFLDYSTHPNFVAVKEIVQTNNYLFFNLYTSQNGSQIWKSDGTVEGSKILPPYKNKGIGSQISELQVVNDQLLFFADDGTETGNELWRSNGFAQTELVKDINPVGNVFEHYHNIPNLNDGQQLYFRAFHPESGNELWKSDGTEKGTYLIKDINEIGSSNCHGFRILPNKQLFFDADDDIHGYEPWISDGTNTGTQLLKDINPDGSSNINGGTIIGGDTFIFDAVDSLGFHFLWKTDGSRERTNAFTSIPRSRSLFSLKGIGDIAYFSSPDPDLGRELFRTDGTEEGTYLVKDLVLGRQSSEPTGFIEWDGFTYFTTELSTNYKRFGQIWRTDGTTEGTQALDFKPYPEEEFSISPLTIFKDELYFLTETYYRGQYPIIWKYNKEQDIFIRLSEDMIKSRSNIYNARMLPLRDFLFIEMGGNGIWQTDGTPAGTIEIFANSSPQLYDFSNLTIFNNHLYFSATDDGFYGNELWRYNPYEEDIKEKLSEENNILIFPNPVGNQLQYFYDEGAITLHEINIVDQLGRVIFTDKRQSNFLDVSPLASGIYYLNIIVGGANFQAKFLKL